MPYGSLCLQSEISDTTAWIRWGSPECKDRGSQRACMPCQAVGMPDCEICKRHLGALLYRTGFAPFLPPDRVDVNG